MSIKKLNQYILTYVTKHVSSSKSLLVFTKAIMVDSQRAKLTHSLIKDCLENIAINAADQN